MSDSCVPLYISYVWRSSGEQRLLVPVTLCSTPLKFSLLFQRLSISCGLTRSYQHWFSVWLRMPEILCTLKSVYSPLPLCYSRFLQSKGRPQVL